MNKFIIFTSKACALPEPANLIAMARAAPVMM